jgi:ribosome-associated toxin RatA of RatAB toxin-antitoxin module
MTTLVNEITVQAPIEKIWQALSNIEELEKYDPTVKRSRAISFLRSGVGAVRKVNMNDGKNWFEERCTLWKPEEALTYELTACSFPIHRLKHGYSFEQNGSGVRVTQVMEYQLKFGWFGKFLDVIMIKKQTDSGVKKFFVGLKSYVESIK